LELYGIQDDKKYFKYLEDIIEKSDYSKQIFFKNPIFGEEKYKIISSAWCNVLISKSEILKFISTRVFKCRYTKRWLIKIFIFQIGLKKQFFYQKNKILNLKRSFKSIMKLKFSERKSIGDKIIKNFDENYSNASIKKRYVDYIKTITANIQF
jgi:hypothetical protein